MEKTVQNLSPEQKAVALSLYLWLITTTFQVAPLNPPLWASGYLYVGWLVLVFVGILCASMTPAGMVVIFSNRLFGKSGAIFLGFLSLWVFDALMRKHYPLIALTPGYALSLVYVFIYANRLKKSEK